MNVVFACGASAGGDALVLLGAVNLVCLVFCLAGGAELAVLLVGIPDDALAEGWLQRNMHGGIIRWLPRGRNVGVAF